MVTVRLSMLSLMLFTATLIIISCSPLDQREQGRAVPMVQNAASTQKDSEDMPVVMAAEVGEVEADMLPEMAQTTEERLSIIEERLNKLRQEMNLLRPAIKELIARQQLAGQLSGQVNTGAPTQITPQPAPVKQAAAPTPAPQPQPQPQPQSQPPKAVAEPPATKPVKAAPSVPKTYQGPAKLASIRTGEHSGKTRMVMDVGSKTSFSYDLDNDEKVLVIELPDAKHEKEITGKLGKSPYIASYATQATDTGSRVIVQLKKAVRVLDAQTIAPTRTQGQRIYFDIGN